MPLSHFLIVLLCLTRSYILKIVLLGSFVTSVRIACANKFQSRRDEWLLLCTRPLLHLVHPVCDRTAETVTQWHVLSTQTVKLQCEERSMVVDIG